GVKALDKQTLQITLKKPTPYFLDILTNFPLFPVQQKTVQKYGNDWTRPAHLVGNGAFQLEQRVVNEKVALRPNPWYWDHQNTVLTKVTYVPANQIRSAIQRYLANDFDIVMDIPNELYAKLKKDIPGQVIMQPELGTYYYAFNTQRPPLNDVRVRQALSLAIDRQIVADKIVGMGEKPAWYFTPVITAGFTPAPNPWEAMTQQERNQQARALLTQAGYSKQHPLKISLLYNNSEGNQRIAVNISSMWKKSLGVETQLINQEWKAYLGSRNSGQFDVIRASWIGDYNEPSTFLSVLTRTHANNFSRFYSEKYDQLLQQAGNEIDESKRNQLYNEAEEIIRQQAPIAPIYQMMSARLVKPWVKGFPTHNPENKVYSRDLYIIKH
ncbi:MAG: peptide ABC transporter substrate-binding protein, partial [Enterobacteriaceae bacterium]